MFIPRETATCCTTSRSVRSICASVYWPASWMIRLRSANLRRELGDAVLQLALLGADLLRGHLAAVVGQRLAKIAQRGLLLLGILVQLLPACAQFLVNRLIGGGAAHHVGHRNDAHDRGRREVALRDLRHHGGRRQHQLQLLRRDRRLTPPPPPPHPRHPRPGRARTLERRRVGRGAGRAAGRDCPGMK